MLRVEEEVLLFAKLNWPSKMLRHFFQFNVPRPLFSVLPLSPTCNKSYCLSCSNLPILSERLRSMQVFDMPLKRLLSKDISVKISTTSDYVRLTICFASDKAMFEN